MTTRRFCTRSFVSLSVIVLLCVSVFADTIRLKDGSVIKGRITAFTGGKFTIAIGEGTSRRRELSFDAEEIESIAFDRNDVANRSAEVVPPVQTNTKPIVEEPVAALPKKSETEPSRPVNIPASMKPIVLNVSVMADNTANGWTNSGWVVKKGQRIRISGTGEVSLGKGQKSSPSGLAAIDDDAKLLKSVPTGALIAVIGDDNNDFIYIGADREFTAVRDGTLFLGLNEGNLNDNSGSFKVKVEISPDS
jgi:PA-IL-like protein